MDWRALWPCVARSSSGYATTWASLQQPPRSSPSPGLWTTTVACTLAGCSGQLGQLDTHGSAVSCSYFVPAFSGLFAPRWRNDARGVRSAALLCCTLASRVASLVCLLYRCVWAWWMCFMESCTRGVLPSSRQTIAGLTAYATKGHIARAALEAAAFQVKEVLEAMGHDGVAATRLKVDGGMTANKLLMQFQADVLNTQVLAS